MKIFLRRVFFFCGIFMTMLLATLLVSTKAVSAYFPFRLNEDTTTIILGDSHPQCGINDAILPHSKNFCEGSDTYFYSYVKLKNLLRHNPQIDTLILGYSYHNIEIGQDKWLVDDYLNSYKLPLYFFMFDRDDLNDYAQFNPTEFIECIPRIISKNAVNLYRVSQNQPISRFNIGAHKSIAHEVSEKERREALSYSDQSAIVHGKADIVYLKKINDLCSEKKVKLILVGPPILHNIKKNPHFAKRYWQYARQNLTDATVLDFVNLGYPPECYADGGHLNAKGAEKFTKMLCREFSKNSKIQAPSAQPGQSETPAK